MDFKADIRDGICLRMGVDDLHRQVLYRQCGLLTGRMRICGHCSFLIIRGSSSSRSTSPSTLTLSRVRAKNRPGKSTMLGYSWKYLRPSAMMLPHEGISGGRPAPSKLKLASIRMAAAKIYMHRTIKGAHTL